MLGHQEKIRTHLLGLQLKVIVRTEQGRESSLQESLDFLKFKKIIDSRDWRKNWPADGG